MCNSKGSAKDITRLDRWLWTLRINHPFRLFLLALAAALVFGLIVFIPAVILSEWLAAH